MKLSPLEEKLRGELVFARSQVVYLCLKENALASRRKLEELIKPFVSSRAEAMADELNLYPIQSADFAETIQMEYNQIESALADKLKRSLDDSFSDAGLQKQALAYSQKWFATSEENSTQFKNATTAILGEISPQQSQVIAPLCANLVSVVLSDGFQDKRLSYFLGLAQAEGVSKAASQEALKAFHLHYFGTKEAYLAYSRNKKAEYIYASTQLIKALKPFVSTSMVSTSMITLIGVFIAKIDEDFEKQLEVF